MIIVLKYKILKKRIKDVIKKIIFLDKIKKIKFQYKIKRSTNDFLLMLTPCHGNLGDQAISKAEIKLLGIDNYTEITYEEYIKYEEIVKKFISKNSVIMIPGGGNLGTLWTKEDDGASQIIDTYSDNKIIIFPQTIYYDDTQEGKRRLESNKKIYASAKDLTICLRDKVSYDFCKQNFQSTNLLYTPDIVLCIDDLEYDVERHNCLLCIRGDKESILNYETKKYLEEKVKENNIDFSYTDTVIPMRVYEKNRDEELEKKWREFASSKLVITDRLHGMIFAAITGTPCLALDNLSKKVSGVYEWIKYLDYIKICSSMDEVFENIPVFYNIEDSRYSSLPLAEKYKKIWEVIHG